MQGRTSQWVAGSVIAVCLVTSSVLAAYFHQRGDALQARLAKAQDQVEIFKHRLLLQQPNAPDVVLDLATPQRPPVATRARSADPADPAEQAARIRELERTLQDKDRQIATLQDRATNRLAAASFQPWRTRENWAENLKRTDPEQYKAMVQRREQARQNIQDTFARQAAQLAADGGAITNATDQEQHNATMKLVADTWQLADQLYGDPPPTNRWTIVQAMHENVQALQPLLASERSRAFYQLALESGYSPDDSAVFVGYLNDVITSTSVEPLHQAMHPGRGGPRVPTGPEANPAAQPKPPATPGANRGGF